MNGFDVYSANDVNVAVELLTTKLNAALDRHAPVRTIQVRSQYAPWLSYHTKLVMRQRDLAQHAATISQKNDQWREYKNLRNTATSCMRKDRASWEKNQIGNLQNSTTDLWRNVKGWMGWKNSGPPTQLFYKGEMVSTPQGLANSMNSFLNEKNTS